MDELRASTERHERDAREQHGDAEETSARHPAAREAQHPVTVDSRSWLLSAYSPEPQFLVSLSINIPRPLPFRR
jgi:hypothetical protein